MTTYNQRDPTCVHSKMPHNIMSFSSAHTPWTCPCEDCTMHRPPANMLADAEQRSFLGFSAANGSSLMPASAPQQQSRRSDDEGEQLSRQKPTIVMATVRRTSTSHLDGPSLSPTATLRDRSLIGSTVMHSPPQRRSSFEYHDSGRVFMQHSTSCACGGSGVGCGCSYSCDC